MMKLIIDFGVEITNASLDNLELEDALQVRPEPKPWNQYTPCELDSLLFFQECEIDDFLDERTNEDSLKKALLLLRTLSDELHTLQLT